MNRRDLLLLGLGLAVLVPGCKPGVKKTKEPVPAVSEAAEERADDLYMKGVYAYANGDTEGAIALWNKTLKVNPRHKKAKDALAEARGKMKAVKALKKKK